MAKVSHLVAICFIGLLSALTSGSIYSAFPGTPWYEEEQEISAKRLERIWGRNEYPEVEVSTPSLGDEVTVLGNIMDDGVHAFRGIKYANASRFQIPVAIDQYDPNTQINATEFGFKCPQSSNISLGLRKLEDEDCQYLNIYTPRHPDDIIEKLSVMVFIHGGYFMSGSSNDFPPGFLAPHDIVLVTINYRLGTLGFFTIDNDTAPGNYALYDQREALRWVRDHIEDFGGSNTSITVFGQSAGSVSASYMTLLADKDSVHKGISESGTTSEVWSVDVDHEYAAKYVADYVDCLNDDNETIDMNCMLDANQFALTIAEIELVAEDRANGLMGFRGCAPTIQPEDVTDAILTHYPQWYYENLDFNDIPYMMGSNKDEGTLVLQMVDVLYLRQNDLFDNATYLREAAIYDILASFGVEDPSHGISNTLVLEYCFGVDITDFYAAAPCLIDMFGVLFLKAGGWKVANLHSYFSTQGTYHYSFDYDNQGGPIEDFLDQKLYHFGVTHSCELDYLFDRRPLDEEETSVSNKMTELWSNFAKYGDPTPDGVGDWSELGIPKYLPYEFGDPHYMLMRADFIMQTEFPLRWNIRYEEYLAKEELTMEPPYTTSLPTDDEKGGFVEDTKEKGTEEGRFVKKMVREISRRFLGLESASRASDQDVEEMESRRDAYMITMIVFIVLFCIAACAACYFFMKSRKRKQVI